MSLTRCVIPLVLSAVSLVLGTICLTSGTACRKAPASPEVVLYTSADQELAQPIIDAFQKQTGIRVLARFDSEADKTVGLVKKLEAEKDSPAADVFWSNEVFHMIALSRKGLLEKYDGPGATDRPARFIDPKGCWHAFALRARVIAYSTTRVKPGEAPKKLEDLLDAKWKGRIAMARPQSGTTGGDVASWFAHYGSARAREILRGLAANKVQLCAGNGPAVRAVAQGRADIALTDSDDVYAAQRNGWPVASVFLDQAGEGGLTIPNSVAIVRGGPHAAQARRLVEFLLSEQVERTLAEHESRHTPVRESLRKIMPPQYVIPNGLTIPYEKVADRMDEALQASWEVLR